MSDYRSDSGGEEEDIPVDQQVTWTYKRPAMIDVNHRINSSSRDGIINDISKVLQEIDTETYQKFEKSVFGRLLKLPKNISRSNVCMHYVISREVVVSPHSDPTVKWYRINEQNLRFSRYEFALVTGLRFGASNFNPYEDHNIPEDSVYTRIFGNEPITPDKLRSMFIDKERIEGATNDDYLKISKVLFVYCVLVAKDCTRHCILDWLWCLVEDDRDWESFPWGSFSYQILFTYLSNIRTCLASVQVQQYHLYGFVTAFLKQNHANDPPDTTYDPDVEEKLTEDSLEQLAMYANGEMPDWGGSLGKWYEYEKVVFAFHQPSKHWGTILIHLAEGSVILYDSFEHVFDQECYDERKKLLIPLVRIFPQILKYTGFYEHRKDLKPFFTQWKFKYPGKENPYNQKDDHSCGPIALKYVEFLMTNEKDPPLLQKDIEKYRAHIARTIYEFSTHEDTIS